MNLIIHQIIIRTEQLCESGCVGFKPGSKNDPVAHSDLAIHSVVDAETSAALQYEHKSIQDEFGTALIIRLGKKLNTGDKCKVCSAVWVLLHRPYARRPVPRQACAH